IPVSPAAHYTMGGIVTDLAARTDVPVLYAAGEVACTGVQGANRLASNSLLECLVFGRRAALASLTDEKATHAGWKLTALPAGIILEKSEIRNPKSEIPDNELGVRLDLDL